MHLKKLINFVQTLLFASQGKVFYCDGEQYIYQFAKTYSKSKTILKDFSDAIYCPKNCKASMSLQLIEWVQKVRHTRFL